MYNNFTNRDPDQTIKYEHDESTNSKRVTVTNVHGLREGIIESLKGLKIEFPQEKLEKDLQVQTISIPTIIKETQLVEVIKYLPQIQIERVEVPVIIKETEIKYIDRPFIVESVKVIEIEKPVVITEFKDLPKGIFLSLGIFLTLNLGLLITLIRK